MATITRFTDGPIEVVSIVETGAVAVDETITFSSPVKILSVFLVKPSTATLAVLAKPHVSANGPTVPIGGMQLSQPITEHHYDGETLIPSAGEVQVTCTGQAGDKKITIVAQSMVSTLGRDY